MSLGDEGLNKRLNEMKHRGKHVIVVCDTCGEQVWTDQAIYIEGDDDWMCDDCVEEGDFEGVGE